jgi:hypothetical protein
MHWLLIIKKYKILTIFFLIFTDPLCYKPQIQMLHNFNMHRLIKLEANHLLKKSDLKLQY